MDGEDEGEGEGEGEGDGRMGLPTFLRRMPCGEESVFERQRMATCERVLLGVGAYGERLWKRGVFGCIKLQHGHQGLSDARIERYISWSFP